MKKLRVRITGIIVLVLFISTALLFWFSWQWTKQSMSAQMEDDYSVVADKYSQELTAWVNARAAVVDSMAAEITVSGIYAEGYDAFHSYLSETCRLLNKDGFIYDIYFTYPDNTMACASARAANPCTGLSYRNTCGIRRKSGGTCRHTMPRKTGTSTIFWSIR